MMLLLLCVCDFSAIISCWTVVGETDLYLGEAARIHVCNHDGSDTCLYNSALAIMSLRVPHFEGFAVPGSWNEVSVSYYVISFIKAMVNIFPTLQGRHESLFRSGNWQKVGSRLLMSQKLKSLQKKRCLRFWFVVLYVNQKQDKRLNCLFIKAIMIITYIFLPLFTETGSLAGQPDLNCGCSHGRYLVGGIVLKPVPWQGIHT